MSRDLQLDRHERARLAVQALAARLDLEHQLEVYGTRRWSADAQGAAVLHIDDFSGIPFLVDITGVEEYQHRARLRAGEADLYAAVTEPTPGYEEYVCARLGLPPVEVLTPEPVGNPHYLSRACGAGPTWSRLVEQARRAGQMTIHPFMGIEAVWELAAQLGEEAGVPVRVLAPPPPVTWIANDKALFDEVVELSLGRDKLVETFASAQVSELAQHLEHLAGRHAQVALKRLRCASAMGNAVFDANRVRGMTPPEIETMIDEFLERTEWQGDEEVLAVAWEQADHSPSTQLWIPPLSDGGPRLDGVYEQILVGERKVFMGSRPSTLADEVNRRLAEDSIVVADAMQALGYVGRCSFDFLVVGDPNGDFELRFTECNGRWGGTSTPMALLDRLFPNGRPAYRARDFVHPDLVAVPFTELLEAVGDEAWDANTGQGRFLFYNAGPLKGHGKLDVIALGATQVEADSALEEDLPRLWGL